VRLLVSRASGEEMKERRARAEKDIKGSNDNIKRVTHSVGSLGCH
jgi:hypothetical protein